MARGTRGRRKRTMVGETRDFGSSSAGPVHAVRTAAVAAVPPPAKKQRRLVDLTILLPPAAVPPSPPSPSPVSPSAPPPPTHPSPLHPHTAHSHPPTPTSPLSPSTTDNLQILLMSRNIQTEVYTLTLSGASSRVQLFNRSQLCMTESYLDQLEHMGMSRGRLDRLVDYLNSAVGPSRIPPARIMSRLWSLSTDLKMAEQLGRDRVLQVSSLFHSLLSLHPPWSSPTATQQYCTFLHTLGRSAGDTAGVYNAWLHIRQLLSYPGCRYFHHHLTFLTDLLLSDFWSHVSGQRSGNPLFVSVFWSSPSSTDSVSLPVRQLVDSITHSLTSYTGNETEFVVLQSQLALLFMVATRCVDIEHNLLHLSLKLSNQQFALLIGCLYPTSLVVKLCQHRHLHPPRPREKEITQSPNSKLPNIAQLSITTVTASHAPHKPPPAGHEPLVVDLLCNVTQLKVPPSPSLAELTAGASSTLPAPPVPVDPTIVITQKSKIATRDGGTKKLPPATSSTVAPQLSGGVEALHKTRRNSRGLGISSSRSGKCRVNWPGSVAKKPRLCGRACENCDTGTLVCHRCT